MRGSFSFDDYPNIVDNTRRTSFKQLAIMVASNLVISSESDPQRPLASLSFAMNYFFSGLNPLPMKVTNLGIHLLNGCLCTGYCYAVVLLVPASEHSIRAIARVARQRSLAASPNLTAVLYVVQRMESLAQTFVLAGLLFYVGARERMLANEPGRKRSGAFVLHSPHQ